MEIKLEDRLIGKNHLVFFVADIGSNHDGDIERAKMLINLAKEAGADAVKFQNFTASKIVSDYGFKNLGNQVSHQAWWKKPVYEIFDDYSLPLAWTRELKEEANKAGVLYFSSPYDLESVDFLDDYMSAYKIGSGDITWPKIMERIASKQKPVFLATGASRIDEVQNAVDLILSRNKQLVLMQCNTNYTGSVENFKYINLNVLRTYQSMYPELPLGLSDHSPGHAAVLGAITLGAVAIEKHFTDDNNRKGPDHQFALNPKSWKEMVDRSRELESALGSGIKKVEDNEKDTVVIQRRCLRATRDLKSGETITDKVLEPLRPAPEDSIKPYEMDLILGRKIREHIKKGEHFSRFNID